MTQTCSIKTTLIHRHMCRKRGRWASDVRVLQRRMNERSTLPTVCPAMPSSQHAAGPTGQHMPAVCMRHGALATQQRPCQPSFASSSWRRVGVWHHQGKGDLEKGASVCANWWPSEARASQWNPSQQREWQTKSSPRGI